MQSTRTSPSTARLEGGRGERPAPTPGERATLYPVLYGELFQQPLTAEEIDRYRPLLPAIRGSGGPRAPTAPDALVGSFLERHDGLYCWRGRDDLVALRQRRRELSAPRWRLAHRYAERLARFPFVRLVAVCGSLAMDNCDEDGDVDVFLVAAPGRVWVVHTAAMLLRRVLGRPRMEICPNLILDEAHLELDRRDLYTARELAQVVPLAGEACYRDVLRANRWIADLLPGVEVDGDPVAITAPTPGRVERWLGGAAGDLLDRCLHRLLVAYFTRRWRAHDEGGRAVRSAYLRHRQGSVAGGYAGAVRDAFCRLARERLGAGAEVEEDLGALFPAEPSGPLLPHFRDLFAGRYGHDSVSRDADSSPPAASRHDLSRSGS